MNRKLLVLTFVLPSLMLGPASAVEPEISLEAHLASAYVFRGTTFNDGPVLQPGMEAALGSLTLGVWGNIDLADYDGTLEKNQFSEIDLYASYALATGIVEWEIGYCEYTFPGAEGKAERELALSLGLDTLLDPALTAAYGVGGGIRHDLYLEVSAGKELEIGEILDISLAVAAGYLSPDQGQRGFSHYEASMTLSRGIFMAGMTYAGQIRESVLADDYDVGLFGFAGLELSLP